MKQADYHTKPPVYMIIRLFYMMKISLIIHNRKYNKKCDIKKEYCNFTRC